MVGVYAKLPNELVKASKDVHYAYRDSGSERKVPMVLFQHFRGNRDNWDPALVDVLASGSVGRGVRQRQCRRLQLQGIKTRLPGRNGRTDHSHGRSGMTMTPTYTGSGDPARHRTDYYPVWLDNLADDVTLEASAMDGAAEGADAVRSIILAVKSLYPYQEIDYAGPYGDNDFIEVYTTEIAGQPLGVAGVVTRNAAGQTEHIVVNHRPRSSVLLLSRLMGDKLAGTPYARYFLTSEP